jgi:hypothetical protein
VAHFGDTWRVTLTKEGNNSDAPITARWTKISTDSHLTGSTALHSLTARYFHSVVLVHDRPVRNRHFLNLVMCLDMCSIYSTSCLARTHTTSVSKIFSHWSVVSIQ